MAARVALARADQPPVEPVAAVAHPAVEEDSRVVGVAPVAVADSLVAEVGSPEELAGKAAEVACLEAAPRAAEAASQAQAASRAREDFRVAEASQEELEERAGLPHLL